MSNYIIANDNDIAWITTVAQGFVEAGSSGSVVRMSDGSLETMLASRGIRSTRQDLTVPPVQAIGNPPTSGYANDPVNTATGNFVENEEDLRFEGASAALGWVRSYSSLSGESAGFGPGWASFDGFGLRLSDDGAHWQQVDGREVFFARLADGFDRAAHENFWLHRTVDGLVVSNSAGARWSFTPSGVAAWFAPGDGSRVSFEREDGRLVGLQHSRGHRLDVAWQGDRIAAVTSDDGRRVDYAYDEAGRLVAATGPFGTRRYEWNEAGLIEAVIDADGVVEARNTYDEKARVVLQESNFGRTTRFAYLPGRVTDISDVDGTRSNSWVADERGRVVGIVDSDGNRTSLAWDAWGNQVLVTDAEGRQTVRSFDDRGRLAIEMQPSGATTRLTHDDLDRLVTILETEGKSEVSRTCFAYEGSQPQPSLVVDAEGGQTRMTWRDGLLVRVVDPTGVRVDFTHDEHGDLVASTDAEGNITRLERDAAGLVTATILPSGATTRYVRDAAGLLTARIEPDGARWAYAYSAGGRLTSIVDPLGAATALEYDHTGALVATVDPLGRRIEQAFDDLGNVRRVRLPDGALWEFTHDSMSRLTQSIDPSGAVWKRHHDRFGRLAETVDPTGVRTFRHVSTANLEVTSGDAAATTTLRTDRWGRELTTVLPDGSQTVVRHDRCGRPAEYVDAVGGRTTIERDAAGRPVRIRHPGGSVVRHEYDACGRLSAVVNELGFRTVFEYDVDSQVVAELWPTDERGWTRHDACGRVTARHVPGSGTFHWVHDLCGRVVETRDRASGRRQFRYDDAGQLVSVRSGNGGTTRYEYDENGRAVRIVDAMGGVTTRTFDAMNRCTSETDPLGRTSTVTYDVAGRVLRNLDPTGSALGFTWDDAGLPRDVLDNGRLLSRTSVDARRRSTTVLDHSDPSRPVTHEMLTDPRGLLMRQSRDQAVTRWTHDVDGLPVAVTSPNGRTTHWQRDASGALVGVDVDGLPGAVLERDAAGRVVRAQLGEASHEWGFTDGFVTRHDWTGDGGSGSTVVERDEWGRTRRVVQDGEATDYTHDEAGQLVGARSATSENTWTYDLGGRLVGESVDSITWQRTFDAAGQLLRASRPGRTIEYTHDAAGRRTQEHCGDGSAREFGWTSTWRLTHVTERRGMSSRRTETHVDAVGELARVDGQELFWDDAGRLLQLGETSTAHVGPLAGVVGQGWLETSWRPERSTTASNPWLSPAPQTSPDHDPGALPGGLQLGAGGAVLVAGMEWLGARVMDPASRSFLSPDPLAPTTGAGWAANPYSYAGNSPLELLDPSGLHPATFDEINAYNRANAPKWGAAVAVVAGVALATVPGMQGVAATIAIGALTTGTGELYDQWNSGYPIDCREVAKQSAFGAVFALGGRAVGTVAGKALGRLAETPAGRAVAEQVGRARGAAGEAISGLTNRARSLVMGTSERLSTTAQAGLDRTQGFFGSTMASVRNHLAAVKSPARRPATPEIPRAPGTDVILYDPKAAAKAEARQLAGQPWAAGWPMTPGGRTMSRHATERIFLGGDGRNPTSMAQVDAFLDSVDKVKWDPMRRTVRVSQTGGKRFVAVSDQGPEHIVTVMFP